DAVHPADAVGDQRDAARRAVLVRDELRLLLAQERSGRRVGDRGHAGVEQVRGARRQPARAALADAGDHAVDDARELALVGAACAHFAALPWSPAARARPLRMCWRNSCGVAAYGVSVNVRPMSTPAWSSLPPTPVPPWVST